MKIGRLTVIELCDYVSKKGEVCPGVKCECDCGNIKIVRRSDFLSGKSKSCGCLIKEFNSNRTTNLKESNVSLSKRLGVDLKIVNKILSSYKAMRYRCYNPNHVSYKNYGKRGIKVCDEWLYDRSKFLEWAVNNGYREGLSIDRIDVNGNYEPSNCRWATTSEQARNMRNNVEIFYNGERFILTDLSKKLHIEEKILRPIAKRGIELWDSGRN